MIQDGGEWMLSDEILQHVGVKGMKWGVRRNRNRPGGADGKEESEKVKDKRGNMKKKLDSMSRERQWNKVLKNVNQLNTKDINTVANRIKLENNMKILSKSKVGGKKDRDDYLRRSHMSDAELSRKVVRLRAKDSLHKAVKDASKEQRAFGEKLVRVGSSLGVKYAITKQPIKPKDVFDAFVNTKGASEKARQAIKDSDSSDNQKDALKYVLDKIDKPKK